MPVGNQKAGSLVIAGGICRTQRGAERWRKAACQRRQSADGGKELGVKEECLQALQFISVRPVVCERLVTHQGGRETAKTPCAALCVFSHQCGATKRH